METVEQVAQKMVRTPLHYYAGDAHESKRQLAQPSLVDGLLDSHHALHAAILHGGDQEHMDGQAKSGVGGREKGNTKIERARRRGGRHGSVNPGASALFSWDTAVAQAHVGHSNAGDVLAGGCGRR